MKWLCNDDDRFPKIQFPGLFWSLKIIPSTAKIFLWLYLLVFLCRKKLKSTFSDILLKTTNKYGRFSAKAFLVRGTAMERHACSYTVWRDVSLKFISANKGLPRAILFHDIYVRESVSGISVISVEFLQSVLDCKNCIKVEVDHDLWCFTVKSIESIISVWGEKFFEMEKKCTKHRLPVKFILGKTPRDKPERFCNIHISGKSVKSVFSVTLFKSFAVYEFHQQSMLNALLFLSPYCLALATAIHALLKRARKERPFWRSFNSYIISDTSSSTNLTSKHDKPTNESSFTITHQHLENRANKRLSFQIYSSKFHSADPLYKHRTHATTFVLRKKNVENKTTMSTAQQRGY